ncbi:FAR-17a/AIG1-like protein-domain-containing protein [Fennellomyces sp. T-0311]|nr:FAR-17a/AIG1-like protein-domain-containing protein [Fennellomyces sp. T-0311]
MPATKSSQRTSIILNTTGLVSNLIALYCVHWVYENPYAVGFGGHFQYLTILGLTTATIAFSLKLLRHMIPGTFEVAYEIVSNIATPLEGLVSCMYWGMAVIDPTLVTPKDMPPIPPIVDCALHLYPAMFLWCDFLIFNFEFKRSPRHIAIIYAFGAFYFAWSWACQSRNGHWPYPFLDELADGPRALFYVLSVTLCWFIYEIGAFVHSKLHGGRLKTA